MSDTTPQPHDPCAAIREEFSALLDDELSPARRATVEAHLGSCAACLRELDAMKRVSDLYAALPHVGAPADFEARVRVAVQPKANVVPWRGRRVVALLSLAAAGLVLVAVPTLLERNAAQAPDLMTTALMAPAQKDLASDEESKRAARGIESDVALVLPNRQEAAEIEADEVALMQAPLPESSVATSADSAEAAPVKAPVVKEQMQALGYGAAAPDEPRKNANAEEPAEAISFQSESADTPEANAPAAIDEMPAPERMADNSAPAPASEPPAAAVRMSAPAPAPAAAPVDADDPAPKKSVDKQKPAARTWEAAGRQFILVEDRWLQDGTLPDLAKPKKLSASSREFKRLVRELPPLEELTAATLPVVFSVGETWYELLPKKS